MSDDVTDVLIVGAGPTGLTLACELAARGASFRIIDSASGPQPGSRGKGLQPRTLELLDRMGIGDRVLAHGRFGMSVRSVGMDGGETISVPAPPPTPDAPYATSLITPQWRVEEALRTRLAELGGEVSFASELAAIDHRDDMVTATIADAEGSRTLSARYLIGCDGGRSSVRRQAGIAFLGETMEDVRMIVADVVVAGLDHLHWHMWRTPHGFLALCPLPSTDSHQLQASVAPGQEPALTLDALQGLVDDRTGRRDVRLRGASWTSLWRCNVRMADGFRRGRVFLAGDAAHVHSPAGGQGMNTGIQDAFNLGWKLDAVLRGAPPRLLDTYEEERLPVAASVLALSNELLRQAIDGRGIVFDRSPRTQQLGITYRGASLSVDDDADDAPIRAGDRAPDAPALIRAGDTARLFDLMRGTKFVVLIFQSASETAAGLDLQRFGDQVNVITIVAASSTSPADWVDAGGHAQRGYGARAGTLFVIRPDGYVGFRGGTSRLLEAATYLEGILPKAEVADDCC